MTGPRRVKETSENVLVEVILTSVQNNFFQHDALCEITTVAFQSTSFRFPHRPFSKYSIFQVNLIQNCHVWSQVQINLLAANHGAYDSLR